MLPYATPQWLDAVGKNYSANPENQNKHFKGMNIYLTFRILADPNLAIDNDIYFSVHVEEGALQNDSAVISKEVAEEKSDFVLSATPQVWKKLIRKQQGFVSAFMTNKIKLDKGLAPRILSLASKSGALIEPFYQVDTEWPDEMSPQRMEQYRAELKAIREKLAI